MTVPTLQQADYPDWLRVTSTVIPVPFIGGANSAIGGFPYAVTSGVVIGTFNVAPWASTALLFTPATVDQRIALTWFDDANRTNNIGQWRADVRATQTIGMIVRNMGVFMTAQIISAAGGALTGNLWLGGSTRQTPGITYQGTPYIVDMSNQTIAAGAQFEKFAGIAYTGPAVLHVDAPTGVNKWKVQVKINDINANARSLYKVTTAAQDVNAGIFLPPNIVSVVVTNLSRVPGAFNANVIEAQNG